MDWALLLALAVGLLLALLFLGVRVFAAFLALNLLGVLVLMGPRGFGLFTNSIAQTATSPGLVTVALFVLMGEILFRSGTVAVLFESVDRLVGGLRGRLYVVTVALACAFGALSGSAVAVAAMLGRSVLPLMAERGYDRRLSAGAVLAGASLAPIIPPSLVAILVGSLADVSIAALLMAGIVPGLLIAGLALAVTLARAGPDPAPTGPYTGADPSAPIPHPAAVAEGPSEPEPSPSPAGAAAAEPMPHARTAEAASPGFDPVSGPSSRRAGPTAAPAAPARATGPATSPAPEPAPEHPRGSAFGALLRMTPFLLVIGSVMGLILAGVATPSESAATGCVGALLVAALFGRATPRALSAAVGAAVRTTCAILVIVACATLFSQLLSLAGATRGLVETMAGLGLGPDATFLVLMLVPFVMCMVVDWLAFMLLAIPIYGPIVEAQGYDPVWFWTLFMINLTVGSMTPPFGYTLFALKGASDLSTRDLFAAAWPVVGVFVLGMALLWAFPPLVTALPAALR